jgi:hypothetical protein
MTIVYLYTALCTVGGADRSIIQKANYLADEMHQDVFIITDSQKERPPVFPISPRIRHIDIAIDFDRQYHHNLLVRGYYYFTLMHLYRKKCMVWLYGILLFLRFHHPVVLENPILGPMC